MKLLLFMVLFLLPACSMGTYKLMYEGDLRVINRETGQECPRLWQGFSETETEDAYGDPCSVIIRRGKRAPVQ